MAAADQRSLGALLADIGADIRQILRGEVQLAKTEAVQNLIRLRSGAVLLMTAAALVMMGIAFLLLGGMFALALKLPLWGAALIVSVSVLLVGAVCAMAGVRTVREMKGVPRTVRSLRETLQWPM